MGEHESTVDDPSEAITEATHAPSDPAITQLKEDEEKIFLEDDGRTRCIASMFDDDVWAV